MTLDYYAFQESIGSGDTIENEPPFTPGEHDPEPIEYASEIADTDKTSGEAPELPIVGDIPQELLYNLHDFFTRRVPRVPDTYPVTLSIDLVAGAPAVAWLGPDRNRKRVRVFTDDSNTGPVQISTDRQSWVNLAANTLPVEFNGLCTLWVKATTAGTLYGIADVFYKDAK